MTKREELELLAEWLGKDLSEWRWSKQRSCFYLPNAYANTTWNPSPEGNTDDWINMVAGRAVDFKHGFNFVFAALAGENRVVVQYSDHNNDKVAAMKHAGYQVCLTAAREGKE